ncbi:MAG: hypothetical protein ACREQL_16530, partial [Candidatus Binatia bacterium]
MIVATAPGKLFVTGEWTVLRGAPAVVAAVDRTVRIELDAELGAGDLTVESLAEGRTWRGDPMTAAIPDGDAGAVVAVVRATGWVHGHVVVDSRGLLVGERKLGLGRSAATIAAATVAVRTLAGADTAAAAVLAAALAANAAFQEGQGSGADVAAAVHGGVVETRRGADALRVVARAWPSGVQLIAGWTGESAATTPLVARFAAMPDPPVLADLAATADAAADAVARGDGSGLCAAVDRSAALLERFGNETG